MTKKFTDLSSSDLSKLPNLTQYHFCIGAERIYLHLFNGKNAHWYLAEYGPIGKRFFGFFEDRSNGISSGFCEVEDLMKLCKKGGQWEPLVDESWKPIEAKEVAASARVYKDDNMPAGHSLIRKHPLGICPKFWR